MPRCLRPLKCDASFLKPERSCDSAASRPLGGAGLVTTGLAGAGLGGSGAGGSGASLLGRGLSYLCVVSIE